MGCRPRHLWEIPVKLAALICLAFFLAAFPALGKAGPKADILQLETESNAAYAANDLDKYFAYYSEDAEYFSLKPRAMPRMPRMISISTSPTTQRTRFCGFPKAAPTS